MTTPETYIPHEWARWIVALADISANEGIGPQCGDLIRWITSAYPDLVGEHNIAWLAGEPDPPLSPARLAEGRRQFAETMARLTPKVQS